LLQRVILALMVALVCRVAVAAEPDDARAVYKRAETAYALGRFNEAAELFEHVFELKQDPVVLFDAAQAHRLAGNKQKALVLYQNYLRMFGERDNRSTVEKRIAELKQAIDLDRASATSPPIGLMKEGKPEPGETTATPPPQPTPQIVVPQLTVTETAPPPKKPAKKAWIAGVVVGGVVVIGAAVALGIVFGSTSSAPSTTLGTVKAN
jgi:tetratricopeptide (TPR) repeat protein